MDSFRDLMVHTDSARREDLVTDMSFALVAEHGWLGLTLRAVAVRCGCSRQAVQQWFGGQEELRRRVATCFVSRWGRWFPARLRAHGVDGLVPESDEVLIWFRFRLALLEHAPRVEWLADLVAFMIEEERAAIAALVPVPGLEDRVAQPMPGDPAVALQALLTGLCLVEDRPDLCLLARKQAGNDSPTEAFYYPQTPLSPPRDPAP